MNKKKAKILVVGSDQHMQAMQHQENRLLYSLTQRKIINLLVTTIW